MAKPRQVTSALPRLHAALGVQTSAPLNPVPVVSPTLPPPSGTQSVAAPAPGVSRLHAAPRLGSLRQWGLLAVAVVVGLLVALVSYDRPQRFDPVADASHQTAGSVAGEPVAQGETGEAPAGSMPGATTGATGAVIHVVGAVHRPGVLALPVGARVGDALTAAGGALPGTDLSGLNLARRVNDGEQIVVGISAVAAAGQVGGLPATNAAEPDNSLINLNQADSDALQDLPRIGPATAEKILRYRQDNGPFTSVDQLLEVPGIGEATLAGLRDLVAV